MNRIVVDKIVKNKNVSLNKKNLDIEIEDYVLTVNPRRAADGCSAPAAPGRGVYEHPL